MDGLYLYDSLKPFNGYLNNRMQNCMLRHCISSHSLDLIAHVDALILPLKHPQKSYIRSLAVNCISGWNDIVCFLFPNVLTLG